MRWSRSTGVGEDLADFMTDRVQCRAMRVICAPDKFKGSLTAVEAAEAMVRGVRAACPDAEIDSCPISDGGEGFVQAMTSALNGRILTTTVLGPLGQLVAARWGLVVSPDGRTRTAILEIASAAGLVLLKPTERDPTRTTTYGLGQLIKTALDHGATEILIGLGGSATNDGGCGAVQALGVKFYNASDLLITEPITGGMLPSIRRIDVSGCDPRIEKVAIRLACDVTSPLAGPQGAAYMYAANKGATPEQVEFLDHALAHLARLIRTYVGVGVEMLPGAGAAGGTAAGLVAFLNARLERGIRLVLETVRFSQRVEGCDLCLTGEGRLDEQTFQGKALMGVARAARRKGVPVVALVGALGPGYERASEAGLSAWHLIGPGLTAQESMARAAQLLEEATRKVVASLREGAML